MKPCVQCKSKPAKWQEESNSKNAYCGSACQQQYYTRHIGLKDDTLGINNDDIVGLESGDGLVKIRITKAQAIEMETVTNLLEDTGSNDYMPLPQIDGPTLLRIEHFLKFGLNTKSFKNEEFESLMVAASYLDFKRLYIYLMPEWINHRPFPGQAPALRNQGFIRQALYFHKGSDMSSVLKEVDKETREDILRFVREYGEQNWQFLKACEDGLLLVAERIVYLQRRRLNPSEDNHRAIYLAAMYNHLDVVKFLLSLTDIRFDPNRALTTAAQYGRLEIVKYLISLKDERIKHSNRAAAVNESAYNGHLNVVEFLLEYGDVNPEVLVYSTNPDVKALYNRYKSSTKKQRVESAIPAVY